MAHTTVGFKNANIPPPLWYRRFVNACIIFFIPMVTGIVQGIKMADDSRNYWMIGIVAVPFLLKGVGMILGNGQIYSPSNEVIDAGNAKS